jgi:hypothetical protein
VPLLQGGGLVAELDGFVSQCAAEEEPALVPADETVAVNMRRSFHDALSEAQQGRGVERAKTLAGAV